MKRPGSVVSWEGLEVWFRGKTWKYGLVERPGIRNRISWKGLGLGIGSRGKAWKCGLVGRPGYMVP